MSARSAPGGRRVTVGVAGCGPWGANFVRNLGAMDEVELAGVADPRPDRRDHVGAALPAPRRFSSHDGLLAMAVEAVVVATPIHTHYAVARDALLAGKHVLVEKPLATSVEEAAELVRLARLRDLVLMAGHTFVYHPVVGELRRLVQSGWLGHVYHCHSARLNLGVFLRHANVVWDLAPHDVSILMYVLDQEPVEVSARGSSCVQPGVHDVCYLEILFAGGTSVNVHVSWLDPDKVRRLTLVGDERMAVFDDIAPATKLRLYDCEVEYAAAGDGRKARLSYRRGEVLAPAIAWREPLRLECEHFVRCVRDGCRALSDGEQGLAVVATLEAVERSLRREGRRVPVELPGRVRPAHPNGSLPTTASPAQGRV